MSSKPSGPKNAPNARPATVDASIGRAGSKSAEIADRRRHPRYRFSEPIKVCRQDAACFDGISVEISESRMSAMVQGALRTGDVVRLQPVTGVVATAVVRHKLGMLYGFEFVELAREEARKIAERCQKCEPWRSNAKAV